MLQLGLEGVSCVRREVRVCLKSCLPDRFGRSGMQVSDGLSDVFARDELRSGSEGEILNRLLGRL